MLLAAGEKLGPYELQEQLGAGGMGEVWKALDTRLNRFVAIKKSHAHFSERFSREARAIAALNHPHICQLYDVGPDYLVMEYVEGKPLTLKSRAPLRKARSCYRPGPLATRISHTRSLQSYQATRPSTGDVKSFRSCSLRGS